MIGKLFKDLCYAIGELNKQDNATHTVHQILFELKESIGISSAVLVVKNIDTDYLEIKNRYNVSAHFTTAYKRAIGTSVVGRIFYKDEIVVVSRKDSPEDEYKDLLLEEEYASAVAVRVAVENRTWGYIAVYFNIDVEVTDELKNFLINIAKICSEAIRKERITTLLNELRNIDHTTGLLYYHYFHEKLKEEFGKCKRHHTALTIAIMDMDNFKEVLNLYGLNTARELYKNVAELLRSCLRGIDVIGRYGTDELIMYLPTTGMKEAEVVIKRFTELLTEKRFTEKKLCTSVSIGVATLVDHETLEELVTHAQASLYNARVTGKNVVECEE
ncbi:MAG: GGDEF domain-containing protein [Nitrospirae bacterium]|nr:GGDEF domain-containing protein [Nitrospirota bacterium]